MESIAMISTSLLIGMALKVPHLHKLILKLGPRRRILPSSSFIG